MRRRKVDEILQPYVEGVPLDPSVHLGDQIIHAIELMVRNNMKCIAVLRNQRPVGIVRLEDAFLKIGLQREPLKQPSP
jgi:CBS domain-containing protein